MLVGGNCLGIVSKHQYNTFFLPQYKLPFHDAPGDGLVAVSQSGAYLVSLDVEPRRDHLPEGVDLLRQPDGPDGLATSSRLPRRRRR